ncbi:hypothetical protein SEUCBS140593_010505 [Sporothrix eucalyptigena]|uniref:FAD dependent oxidoreductase domain-containing protein n=1 Tax=Sporothrix eucalyptigena TaxID=1812306 RepID=A0ABP0D1I8_9PEZI
MTSVSLCRSLLATRPELNITVLDARGLCAGATGRNGGHVKAVSPGVWYERKKHFGVKEALRIMAYEHSHVDYIAECVRENNIDCDLHLVEGLDVYHDTSIYSNAVSALEDLRKYDPSLASRYTVYMAREELDKRNCRPHVVGAIGMPAATCWPYKFVTFLFAKMLKAHSSLNIQSTTAVTAVLDSDVDDADTAVVRTDRGDIRARHVVHATNCWVGDLLPKLRPFVSPVRANVQRQVPLSMEGKPAPITWRAENSFWLRYAEHDYDYMVQRPDGAFIIVRANTGRRATSDDSTMDLHSQTHIRGTTPLLFDFRVPAMQTTHAWSGLVAFTLDGSPFVGQLPFPGRSHQWVCAAYQGIGMVRAFRTAQLLAMLILGKEVPTDYPRSMFLTTDRVRKFNGEVSKL